MDNGPANPTATSAGHVAPALHTRTVRLSSGVRLAYVREGAGYPLLLIHGYPMTKRIWWRNIGPLAAAGFDVIAPDLRGYGESGLAPDGFYDPAAYSSDLDLLLTDELDIERCSVVGGDLGGAVAIDMALRFPGLVERLCLFNGPCPNLPELFKAAGIPTPPPLQANPVADYFIRQGTEPDQLLLELDTPERRRQYVASFYGHRLWAAPGAFNPDEIAFMTEPFGDADRLRASWVDYEVACERRQPSTPDRLSQPVSAPALVLYGAEDHLVDATFVDRCALAFTNCIGPFVVPGAGHFLQWEKAEVLNRALTWFLADLRWASLEDRQYTSMGKE